LLFSFFFPSEKKDFLKEIFFLLCYDPQLLFSFVHEKKKVNETKKVTATVRFAGSRNVQETKKKNQRPLSFLRSWPACFA